MKLSKSQIGRIISNEHREKISQTLKNNITPEERERLSIIGKLGAESRWNERTT